MNLNNRSEMRKEMLNYRKENIVFRYRLLKVTDKIKDFENGENPIKALRDIANIIRYE